MSRARQGAGPGSARIETRSQTSAGGVAYRRRGSGVEVALISVGPKERWQLPKGLVEPGESAESTAVREVAEEAGIETRLIAPLRDVEYWYVGTERDGMRVRYHKRVHFFLLEYERGDVANHDSEVNEARWVPLDEAAERLAFANEREVLAEAASLLRD